MELIGRAMIIWFHGQGNKIVKGGQVHLISSLTPQPFDVFSMMRLEEECSCRFAIVLSSKNANMCSCIIIIFVRMLNVKGHISHAYHRFARNVWIDAP
jgi:hypothetical protein